MGTTYRQYINRLIEWTDGYYDLVAARIEFDQWLSWGFTFDEAFDIVLTTRHGSDHGVSRDG